MGLTFFSFLILPLCLVWIVSPDRLLQLAALMSCFEAAAALIVGHYGLQPGLVPAVLFMGNVLLQLLLGATYQAAPAVWRMFRPLAMLVVYGVVSAYLMPRLFHGVVFVWPQKPVPPLLLSPLDIEEGYLNQAAYLVLDFSFVVLSALYLSKPSRSLVPFVNAYFLSGFVVAAIAIWQFVSRVFGVPFPSDFFYSNPDWAILSEQSIGAVPRINGPFSEPASLGAYMGSIVCATGWLLIKGRRETLVLLLFLVGLVVMVMSTSTTGFAVLAIAAFMVAARALLTGSTRMVSATLKVGVPLLLVGGMVVTLACLLIPGFGDSLTEILTSTLTKQDSTSYTERTSSDLDSLAAMKDSYGLGVGWGNNRSSSLIPGLLAGVGIPGMACVLWFIFGIRAQVLAARRLPASSELHVIMDTCVGALTGFVLSAVIAGPTITATVFYFLLGLLIACTVRVQYEARAVAAWRAQEASAAARRQTLGGLDAVS